MMLAMASSRPLPLPSLSSSPHHSRDEDQKAADQSTTTNILQSPSTHIDIHEHNDNEPINRKPSTSSERRRRSLLISTESSPITNVRHQPPSVSNDNIHTPHSADSPYQLVDRVNDRPHGISGSDEDNSPSPTPTHPKFTPHLHSPLPLQSISASADALTNQLVNPSASSKTHKHRSHHRQRSNQKSSQPNSANGQKSFFTRGVSAGSQSESTLSSTTKKKAHKGPSSSPNHQGSSSTVAVTTASSPSIHGDGSSSESETDPNDDSQSPSPSHDAEPSFSFTPSSSVQSTSTSSTSSLPSTATCLGRFLRAVILRLRGVVNSRTKKILMVSSMVSLMFIIGTIIYFYFGLQSIRDDYNWVIHTETVKLNIEYLFSSILNAETSARGYVITLNQDFLKPYNQSVSPNGTDYVWLYFNTVFEMTEDNPVQQDRRNNLSNLVQARYDSFSRIIDLAAVGNFTASRDEIVSAGYSIMPQIRSLLNDMALTEQSLLDDRQSKFDLTLLTMTTIMFIVLSCVALTIISGLLIGYDWDTRLLKRTNSKLEVLLTKAEEGTKLKSLFLANMSHEIRTPMNGVLAMTQLLASTPLSADQHDIVDTVLQSGEAMMRLINDLLLFSKIEAGKFSLIPEWFYLPLFLRPITDMYTIKADGKGISFSTLCDRAVPSYLFVDSGRLRQVLVNLCDNATKFTHHGHVKLHVSFVRRMIPIRDPASVTTSNQATPSALVHRLHERLQPNESQSSSKENSANKLSFTPGGTAQLTLKSVGKNGAGTDTNTSTPQPVQPSPSAEHPSPIPASSTPTNSTVSSMTGQSAPPLLHPSAGSSIPPPQPQFEDRYYIIFSVSDTGIGIAPTAQKYIFEPFSQADMSTTKEYGGTGLGLSISSQLVKAMGGKLKLRSQLGHGSIFEFAVPMTAEQLAHSLDLQEKDEGHREDEDVHVGGSNKHSIQILPTSALSFSLSNAHAGTVTTTHPNSTSNFHRTAVTGAEARPSVAPTHAATAAHLSGLAMLPTEIHSSGLNRIDEQDDAPSSSSVDQTHGSRPLKTLNVHHGNGEPQHSNYSPESSLHSMSGSRSVSHSIKWHDWFEPEYYSDAEREEQRQLMILQQSLALPPDHFNDINTPTPPSLVRTVQSAPILIPTTSGSTTSQSSPSITMASTPANATSSTRIFTSSDNSGSFTMLPMSSSQSMVEMGSLSTSIASHSTSSIISLASPPPVASSTANLRAVSEGLVASALAATAPLPSTALGTNLVSGISKRVVSVKPGLITAAGPRLRVLVVEDNPVNQKVAKRLLERDGHAVVLANNGAEALEIHATDREGFDVVLMDLAMPVMDGITATKQLRHLEAVAALKASQQSSQQQSPQPHSPHTSNASLKNFPMQAKINSSSNDEYSPTSLRNLPENHLPIIAVTASALDEDVDRCMAAGFDSLIHKPISVPLLAKAMNDIAAKKQSRSQSAAASHVTHKSPPSGSQSLVSPTSSTVTSTSTVPHSLIA